MAEYIERATVLALQHLDGIGLTRWGVVNVDDIEKLPAADVAPVVHGKWIHDINNLYGCSECGSRETMPPKRLKKFCHECGARMDGDG